MQSTKKCTVILTIVAFVMSIMAATAFAEESSIDWEKGVIRAVGYASGKTKPQAKRAARMDAMRNLAEQVQGVQVTAESKMIDLVFDKDLVVTRVNAVVSGMQEVATPTYENDGNLISCELVMEIPLFGSSNSVASTFADFAFKKEEKVPFPLPTTMTNSTTKTTTETTTTTVVAAANSYTGLVVDCSGLGLKPVMSPVIVNSSGQAIYGHKNLDYDKVIAYGMASYIRSINDSAASRAGDNPIVVKAISVETHKANPVVTVSDADSILIANQGAHFLDNCAVVFIR